MDGVNINSHNFDYDKVKKHEVVGHLLVASNLSLVPNCLGHTENQEACSRLFVSTECYYMPSSVRLVGIPAKVQKVKSIEANLVKRTQVVYDER